MMVFHAFSILNVGLGAAVAVTAVLLWAGTRKLGETLLSLTAVLLYAAVLLELLASYGLFGSSRLPAGDAPLARSAAFSVLLAAMLVTLIIFYRGKRQDPE